MAFFAFPPSRSSTVHGLFEILEKLIESVTFDNDETDEVHPYLEEHRNQYTQRLTFVTRSLKSFVRQNHPFPSLPDVIGLIYHNLLL